MRLVVEPSVTVKVRKMQERVRWEHPLIVQRGIDQTRLAIADGQQDEPEFSFLVIGDSGTGRYRGDNPQRRVAQQMLTHGEDCRFVLHTGDVVYLVGSSEQYPDNFIKPYREFLVDGDQPGRIRYDRMTFKRPILPVLGNHDYYDLPWVWGGLAQATLPLRYLLRSRLDLDVGWHGSFKGDAFARAFLDYLREMDEGRLARHLDHHYTAVTDTGRCLCYQPGQFTRLPNRYYTFRYGGIDFFALDSNTFNTPLPLPDTARGAQRRQQLEARRRVLEQQRVELLRGAAYFDPTQPDESEQQADLVAKLEQVREEILDLDKQLSASKVARVDFEQLHWLQQRLIESWQTSEVRGRILYFHHPPYVTEATKWDQGQTLAVRHHLRQVLNAVQDQVGDRATGRPLVDLVLTGHAHCLEYLRTEDTGHADADLNWVICGGSGYSLRRQRSQGAELEESMNGVIPEDRPQQVARSHLFVGRSGHGSQKRRPYSFVRIDVQPGMPPQLIVRPFIVEKVRGMWHNRQLEPLHL